MKGISIILWGVALALLTSILHLLSINLIFFQLVLGGLSIGLILIGIVFWVMEMLKRYIR